MPRLEFIIVGSGNLRGSPRTLIISPVTGYNDLNIELVPPSTSLPTSPSTTPSTTDSDLRTYFNCACVYSCVAITIIISVLVFVHVYVCTYYNVPKCVSLVVIRLGHMIARLLLSPTRSSGNSLVIIIPSRYSLENSSGQVAISEEFHIIFGTRNIIIIGQWLPFSPHLFLDSP